MQVFLDWGDAPQKISVKWISSIFAEVCCSYGNEHVLIFHFSLRVAAAELVIYARL
jgi:hypothetical protein